MQAQLTFVKIGAGVTRVLEVDVDVHSSRWIPKINMEYLDQFMRFFPEAKVKFEKEKTGN